MLSSWTGASGLRHAPVRPANREHRPCKWSRGTCFSGTLPNTYFFVSFHSAWQGAKPTTPLLLLDGKGPSRKPLFMLLSPLCSHRLNSRTPRLFLASHFCGRGTCTVARPFFKAVPRSHAGQNLYSMLVFFRGYAYYSQNGSMCVCV